MYLKRWALLRVMIMDEWTIEELLTRFVDACWDSKVADIARGLQYSIKGASDEPGLSQRQGQPLTCVPDPDLVSTFPQ